jgi:hypothetical protein
MVADRKRLRKVIDGNFPQFIAIVGECFLTSLTLSRVHWVRPEMLVEVSFAEWTPDGLLRHVVYLGEREDKLAINVCRDPPPLISTGQGGVRNACNFLSIMSAPIRVRKRFSRLSPCWASTAG